MSFVQKSIPTNSTFGSGDFLYSVTPFPVRLLIGVLGFVGLVVNLSVICVCKRRHLRKGRNPPKSAKCCTCGFFPFHSFGTRIMAMLHIAVLTGTHCT